MGLAKGSSGATVPLLTSAGSPEGVVTGTVGQSCEDTTNGVLYVKHTGTGNTGWTLVGSGGGTTGPARQVVSKTANYTAVDGDMVLCDATGGAFTITLPAVGAAKFVSVKKKDASANAITVSPASGTIDGAASQLISTQYTSLDFVSDATNWFLV